MYTIEAPGIYALPPQDGPLQARFNANRHRLLDLLNKELDARGKYHGNAATGSPAQGYAFHPELGGDPFYLSESVVSTAKSLASAGRVGLALETLDIASRWPGTQVGGVHYSDIAINAARRRKVNFALAIALDSRRMFGPHGARRYGEIVPLSETNLYEVPPAGAVQDTRLPYNRAQFAAEWLCGVSRIYREVAKSEVKPDASLRTRVGEAIDLYSTIFDAQLAELTTLPENRASVAYLLTGLGFACVSLRQANEPERAAYLQNLGVPGN